MLETAQRHLRQSLWKMFHTMISFGFLLVTDNISIKLLFKETASKWESCNAKCVPAQRHGITWLTFREEKNISSLGLCHSEHVLNQVSSFLTRCFRALVSPGIKLIFYGHETRAVEKKYQRAYLNLGAKRRENQWLCEPLLNMNIDCVWSDCFGTKEPVFMHGDTNNAN